MRVAIATRIFDPEPSAASFRLAALAATLADAGHEVTVLTTTPPKTARGMTPRTGYRVRRFPVLRDRTGYVRGYIQYLSFDLPLFFRILFGAKQDAIIVEPPPTTWLLARWAAGLRRTPLFVYAPDIWSDASESARAPGFVVSTVRWMERLVCAGACGVLAVNAGVAERIQAIAPRAKVKVVGNGIDTETFRADGGTLGPKPFIIYSGTASEWQGAEIFVRACAQLKEERVEVRLVFLGQGTAVNELRRLAAELHAPVDFHSTVSAADAAAWLRGAVLSLASIRPGSGYDFAFPTKIYASWACGTPVVYAGPGPARTVFAEHPELGRGVEYDVAAVAAATRSIIEQGNHHRAEISEWAQRNVSLAGVAARVIEYVERRLGE